MHQSAFRGLIHLICSLTARQIQLAPSLQSDFKKCRGLHRNTTVGVWWEGDTSIVSHW